RVLSRSQPKMAWRQIMTERPLNRATAAPLTLDQRLANAFADEANSAADLELLIAEVEATAAAAAGMATIEHKRAKADRACDRVKADEAARISSLQHTRLTTALVRLRIMPQERCAADYEERWRSDRATVVQQRDSLADELREFYQATEAK